MAIYIQLTFKLNSAFNTMNEVNTLTINDYFITRLTFKVQTFALFLLSYPRFKEKHPEESLDKKKLRLGHNFAKKNISYIIPLYGHSLLN